MGGKKKTLIRMDEELGISVIFFGGKLLSAFQPKNSPNFWYHKKKTLGLAKLGKESKFDWCEKLYYVHAASLSFQCTYRVGPLLSCYWRGLRFEP